MHYNARQCTEMHWNALQCSTMRQSIQWQAKLLLQSLKLLLAKNVKYWNINFMIGDSEAIYPCILCVYQHLCKGLKKKVPFSFNCVIQLPREEPPPLLPPWMTAPTPPPPKKNQILFCFDTNSILAWDFLLLVFSRADKTRWVAPLD